VRRLRPRIRDGGFLSGVTENRGLARPQQTPKTFRQTPFRQTPFRQTPFRQTPFRQTSFRQRLSAAADRHAAAR
jgi:hypothetical protein